MVVQSSGCNWTGTSFFLQLATSHEGQRCPLRDTFWHQPQRWNSQPHIASHRLDALMYSGCSSSTAPFSSTMSLPPHHQGVQPQCYPCHVAPPIGPISRSITSHYSSTRRVYWRTCSHWVCSASGDILDTVSMCTCRHVAPNPLDQKQ